MKNLRKIAKLTLLLALSSCAYLQAKNSSELQASKKRYALREKSGEFTLYREIGFSKEKKHLITKSKIFVLGSSSQPVERNIAISKFKKHEKDLFILFPDKGQTDVWFDKKRYRTKFEVKGEEIIFKLKTPEEKWQGVRKFNLPKGNGVICLFSQVYECARHIGFFAKAIQYKAGSMNFHIVWDSYPFIQEQYEGLKKSPFTTAQFRYEGKSKNLYRFGLYLSGQTIYYSLNLGQELERENWILQGRSLSFIGE